MSWKKEERDSQGEKFFSRASKRSQGEGDAFRTSKFGNFHASSRRILYSRSSSLADKDPVILLDGDFFLEGRAEFLIDTGSELNLIKKNTIKNNITIKRNCVYNLIGIGKGVTKTLGEIEVIVKEKIIKFQVVAETFQIKQKGILGVEFLKSQEAILKFKKDTSGELIVGGVTVPFETHTTIKLPARHKVLVTLPVKRNELLSGYVQKIKAGPGLFLGEALVTPQNGKIKIFAMNATSEDIELTLPPIELEDFDILNQEKLTSSDSHSEEKAIRIKRMCDVVRHLDLNGLNEEEKRSLLLTLYKFPYQFHLPNDKLGSTNVTTHKINSTDNKVINVRQYRQTQFHKEEARKHVTELLKNDIIKHSNSPYNFPLLIVPKKPDSQGQIKTRMVIDYRALNEKTISDAYPLPNICDILDQLGGAKYFSTLDLASGFHQIPMDPDSQQKTAFSSAYGHYEYKRMPFGLKNAPSTFQRLMDQVLSGLQGLELFVYMDDIVIYASSLEEHSHKLKRLLGRLKTAGLTLQPDKCYFLKKEIAYLGHIITRDGVKPDPRKIEAVREFPRPKTRKNIKQFLGLIGYYRRFIHEFAKIAKPLTLLTKLGIKYHWDQPQQEAFEKLRDLITTQPILQYPDFKKPFIVTTDASNYAIGAVLSQGKIGEDLPIAYASRTLNDAETRYATIEKELLAILFGVENFRPYLYGKNFTLVTDHRPLVWLHNVKNPGSRLVRWSLRLKEYDYIIVYKPGKINSNADALSRNPVIKEKTCKAEHTLTGSSNQSTTDKLNLNSHDFDTDTTFAIRDVEQIPAIDGTVSAPRLDSKAILPDEDFYPSDQLVNNAFKLFSIEADYDINDAIKNDDVPSTCLQALPIEISVSLAGEEANKESFENGSEGYEMTEKKAQGFRMNVNQETLRTSSRVR